MEWSLLLHKNRKLKAATIPARPGIQTEGYIIVPEHHEHVHQYPCTYIAPMHTCTHTYTHQHVRTHTRVHAHTHQHICTHMHTHTPTHTSKHLDRHKTSFLQYIQHINQPILYITKVSNTNNYTEATQNTEAPSLKEYHRMMKTNL